MAMVMTKPLKRDQSKVIETVETKGFGAPKELGAHLFIVNIPSGRGGYVEVVEYFGFGMALDSRTDGSNSNFEATRARIHKDLWSKVADDVRLEFNSRLKARSLATSKWAPGENYVEKLLGRELAILLWAIGDISQSQRLDPKSRDEKIAVIVARWMALRPEERWWLFLMAVGEIGSDLTQSKGWRVAIYYALSGDSPLEAPVPHKTRTRSNSSQIGVESSAKGVIPQGTRAKATTHNRDNELGLFDLASSDSNDQKEAAAIDLFHESVEEDFLW